MSDEVVSQSVELGNETLDSSNQTKQDELSTSSSNSSFVPIDKQVVFDAVQVINEQKKFNNEILDYIEKTSPVGSIGNNYHIISVFGSQSTGKSTLLNRLFNTNFDVMDETKRQQTTKGIWMAYSPMVNSKKYVKDRVENIFVMDVEGTDGRERGEDQDFERKAALFALSTSEILIINIWETQIGLYQGANMGLLKTVFEVNLSLFGKTKKGSSKDEHKVLLLFVIRDHLGVTPLENLAATVTQDLIKMWDDLNKPSDLGDLKFEEFFDIKFHTLSHKILQADMFNEDVKLLGDKFIDSKNDQYYWNPKYHHNIPIDGWTMYASNCWDQIDSNKDLDLPTQQILVAKFKCDEIVNSLYEEFLVKFGDLLYSKVPTSSSTSSESDIDYKEIGLLMEDLKDEYLQKFELMASKYNQSVYEQKSLTLQDKIIDKYKELFNIYSKKMMTSLLAKFNEKLSSSKEDRFIDTVRNLKQEIGQDLLSCLSLISMKGLISHNAILQEFMTNLDEAIAKQQKVELDNIISKSLKRLSTQLNKYMVFEINDIKENSWDNIYKKFEQLIDDTLANYQLDGSSEKAVYDFGLGIDQELTNYSVDKLKFKSWVKFYQLIKKNLSKSNILNILKERFDDKFRYDDNGLPRLYSNEFELEANFNEAKGFALKCFPLLTLVRLSNSSEIIPEYDIFNKDIRSKYGEDVGEDEEEDDNDEEDANKFAHIIGEIEKAEVMSKFKKEIDAKYIETKRSLVQLVTSIPYYIYLIIIVLGWNEFMAVLRSPIFFTFALMLGAIGYIMYQLNLIKPAMAVGQKMVEESIQIGKAKLREFLQEADLHQQNLSKMAGKNEEVEEIELDDLSK